MNIDLLVDTVIQKVLLWVYGGGCVPQQPKRCMLTGGGMQLESWKSAADRLRANRIAVFTDFGNMPGKLHGLPKKVL